MDIKEVEISFDGRQVKSSFCDSNGYVMVPALVFKHAGVQVDYNCMQKAIMLNQNKTIITFYKDQYEVQIKETTQVKYEKLATVPFEHNGEIYVPLHYVIKKLGMSLLEMTSNIINLATSEVRYNNVVSYKGPAKRKAVALTFDDGPEDIYTPQILDILQQKKVKATFFVLGERIGRHPEIFKRMIQQGHEVGNHSWSHPNFMELTLSELKNEIKNTETEIYQHLGKSISILRPPYGLFTKSDIQIIGDLGYKVIMWSVQTLDYTGLAEEEILSIVNRDVTDGSIVIQHCFRSLTGVLDGTIKALPKIIEKLLNEGYEIVTVSELLGL